MTVQFIRQARLQVGQPGNPARIGTPATTTTTPSTISDTGVADFGITNGRTVAVPAIFNAPAIPGDGLDLSAMRFRFSVASATIQTPKTMELRIYNLSRSTSTRIFTEFTRARLVAGYAGNLGLIFDGTLTSPARIGRESSTDTVLDITAAESDLSHNFATVTMTLAAGSTPNERLTALTKALAPYGISAGYQPPLNGPALPRGRVMFGMVRDHLRDLAKATGCDWHIEDDLLHFLPREAFAPGDAIVLNSRTGLVGLPVQTYGGIQVRCLLNPAIKAGRAIKIDNSSIQKLGIGTNLSESVQAGLRAPLDADGIYKVFQVSHTGDTRGHEWYTDAVAVSASAGVSAGALPKLDPAITQ